MQATLAAVELLSSIAAWLAGASFLWVVAGVPLGSVILFTLIVILPTNKQGALRSGGGTKCRIDPAVVRFQANRKCFNTPNVLEHFLENRETVECISQFAMFLRVCNRQSP